MSSPDFSKVRKKCRMSRLYKKSSNDGMLTLFIQKRELFMKVDSGDIDKLYGVALLQRQIAEKNVLVNVQVSLELRYGREDEELMGLQFCNEMVVANKQLTIPAHEKNAKAFSKYGCCALPFTIDLGSSLPPTIRLKPTRRYTGSPIGTTYTLTVVYMEEQHLSKPPKKSSTIHMKIKLTEIFPPVYNLQTITSWYKTCNIMNGKMCLQACLDKSFYSAGDTVNICVFIFAKPKRKIRYLKVTLVQSVDVAMFASGFFKNNVGYQVIDEIDATSPFYKRFSIRPEFRPGKHWVAVCDRGRLTTGGCGSVSQPPKLASSVILKDRSLFIIRVMYYAQISAKLSHQDIQIKIPFLYSSD